VLRPNMAERALLIPGTELIGGCTIRYAAPDFPIAYRMIELVALLGGIGM
jgi:D-amino peptidase